MVSLGELNSIVSKAVCFDLAVSSLIQSTEQYRTSECNLSVSIHSEEQC